MPARYFARHSAIVNTAPQLLIALQTNIGLPRVDIYEIELGTAASVSDDFQAFYKLSRGTGAIGGVALNENTIDPNEGSSQTFAFGHDITGETRTANTSMLTFACNQRGVFRWMAKPKCGIKTDNSASNLWTGLDSVTNTQAAVAPPTISVSLSWEE
jgi:hypothetical protein